MSKMQHLRLFRRVEINFTDGSTSYCYVDPEGLTGFLAYTEKKAAIEFDRLVHLKGMTDDEYEAYKKESAR